MGSRPSALQLVLRLLQPSGRGIPATLGIAALTVAVFALEAWVGGTTDLRTELRLGGLRADRVVEHWELFRLAMPMLLHHGALHLVLNLVALLQLAGVVELLWGSRRLVVFYVASGIAAALASAAFNTAAVAVGASGAIFGLAGVLLGASMYGDESVRRMLGDLSPRLRRAVLLTLVVGIGLWGLNLVPIDNAAHVGGLLTGFLLAAAHPDPLGERRGDRLDEALAELEGLPGPLSVLVGPTPGFVVAVTLMVGAMGATAAFGGRALATLEIDNARLLAERASRAPGSLGTVPVLVDMLRWYDEAGAADQGVDTYRRAVDKFDSPLALQALAGLLMAEAEDEGVDRDLSVRATLERWLAVEPENSDAFNALAWHLVTAHDPARRDPVEAERLSRHSLERIVDPSSKGGRQQRASYLDTLAEALYQQGRFADALEAQRESVELARELGLAQLPEMSARLAKIEDAAG